METSIATEKLICIGGRLRSPHLIHYGSTVFLPERLLPVRNMNVKPEWHTGLWTSPVDSKRGWSDWCRMEDYGECNENNSFTLCLKEGARILVIDSMSDLMKAPLWVSNRFNNKYLDFELISEQYDAIWLTDKGQEETHYSRPTAVDLYGWDCESVLILNADCVYQID